MMLTNIPINCSSCGKTFRQKGNLNKHIRTAVCINDELQREYACEVCDKRFNRKSSLKTHISFVHNHEENKYKCEICTKSFKNANGLKTSLR